MLHVSPFMLGTLVSLPEFLLLGGALILLLWGAWRRALPKRVLLIGLITSLLAGLALLSMSDTTTFTVSHFYTVSPFILLMKTILLLAGIVIALLLHHAKTVFSYEHTVLLITSLVGMLWMQSASHMLMLYMALELQSLSLYILIAARQADHSTEAALKYYILGALASGLMLFGMAFIYGSTGSMEWYHLAKSLEAPAASPALILGVSLFLIGIFFKASLVPFHMWTVDVYQGLSLPLLAVMSVLSKLAIYGVAIRLALDVFSFTLQWDIVFRVIAWASMLGGAFGACFQTRIRRLLGFSTITHSGFIMLALSYLDAGSAHMSFFYLVVYAVTSLGLIAALMSIGFEGNRPIDYINDLSGLHHQSPLIAFVHLVLLLSLMGLPPTPGFLSKLFVIQQAIAHGDITSALIAVTASVIAAFYYLRLIKTIYMADSPPSMVIESSPALLISIILPLIIILYLIICPSQLLTIITAVL